AGEHSLLLQVMVEAVSAHPRTARWSLLSRSVASTVPRWCRDGWCLLAHLSVVGGNAHASPEVCHLHEQFVRLSAPDFPVAMALTENRRCIDGEKSTPSGEIALVDRL